MKTLSNAIHATLALTVTSQAYVVDLFSDQNCQNPAGSRNVYDNTCAPLGGFQSFRLTVNGNSGQVFRAYSPNNCGGTQTSCGAAVVTGQCFPAVNGDGGSNAMSSFAIGCI